MKYYIGSLTIFDHKSKRIYDNRICIAAEDDTAGRDLLERWAEDWEVKGERQPDGGYLCVVYGAEHTVYPKGLHEISAGACAELRQVLPGTGDFQELLR
jgi:hypothetical protein